LKVSTDVHRSVPVIAVLILISIAAVPAHTAGDRETMGYEMTVSNTVDTPTRSVTLQEQNHEVSGVTTVDPGNSVSVSVTAPDETYRVYLYNGDEQIIASKRGEGDGSFTFDLSGYEPGSYMLAVYHDGEYQTVHPVVVRGYDVSVDATDTVTEGEEVDVTVEVTETADAPSPDSVEVALADDEDATRVTATRESRTTYTASVPTSELGPGEYSLYAAVQIDEQAFDEQAIVGVSDSTRVSITERSTTTEDDSSSDGSSSGDGSTMTPGTTAAETTTSATATTTQTETTAATTDETTMSTTEATTTAAPTSAEPTTEDDSVLTPDESTTTQSGADSDSRGQPGLGILATVAAALAMGILASGRARRR
jgi:hypothetical protein